MEPLAVHPSRPDVVLRRAVAADLPALLELLRDDVLGATRETDDLHPYEQAFARIDADEAHLLLVVTAGERLVGTAQLTFLPSLSRQGGTRAQVEAVRIAADQRSGGLGGWLLGWIVDEASRRGCVTVQLTTDRSRVDAQRFYRRLGFVESHVALKLPLQQ